MVNMIKGKIKSGSVDTEGSVVDYKETPSKKKKNDGGPENTWRNSDFSPAAWLMLSEIPSTRSGWWSRGFRRA